MVSIADLQIIGGGKPHLRNALGRQRLVQHHRTVRMRERSSRSSTAFTTLKMAVLAPIPSASAVIAMKVKPGLFRSRPDRVPQIVQQCVHIPQTGGVPRYPVVYAHRVLPLIISMTADIEQVTRLQSLDLKIADLQREVAALPKYIAQIEKALESHLRRLEADRAALSANQKDRKRLEDDIKVHDQKVSKLKDQMLLAKNNEQYRAFQHEIDYAANEIRKCEDRILDLMTESEPLDLNVKKAEVALKQESQQVETEKARARERTASDQKQLEQLQSERKQVVAKLKPTTYSAYERIRKKKNGLAAVEAVEGRCSACQIALRPQFFQDLRKGDELMLCESCGRILYYNPPVSFEHDLAEPAPSAQSAKP